jgi:hypothetical protein
MPQYRQLFQDAERQQALADALTQKAMTARQPQQHGRIVSEMGLGEGLGQLGEAWLARRAGKKASSMTGQAEEARRQAQAQALSGMATPQPGQNPYAAAQGALEADVAGPVVGQYLKNEYPDPTSGADSSSLAGYRQAKSEGYEGTYTDYKKDFEGREANIPADIQKWRLYNELKTPEEKAAFLEVLRSVPIETVNQVPTRILGGGAPQQPLSTLGSEAAAAETINDAKAEGTETGQARGTAIANLPSIQSTTRAALETVDKMLEHPGMGTATGLSGTLDPRNYVPGTSARDFQVLRNQAQGQVFLDAYQALKGGGVITEVEGLKAEQAKARMDTAQSDEEFRAALNDYANALRRGLQLAEQRAGMVTGGGFGGDVPTIQVPNRAPPDDPLGLRR